MREQRIVSEIKWREENMRRRWCWRQQQQQQKRQQQRQQYHTNHQLELILFNTLASYIASPIQNRLFVSLTRCVHVICKYFLAAFHRWYCRCCCLWWCCCCWDVDLVLFYFIHFVVDDDGVYLLNSLYHAS